MQNVPVVEWSINIGTVGAIAFAIAGFYWVTKSDMRVMKENVVAIKGDLKALTELMKDVAVQKTALEHHAALIAAQATLIATLEDRLFKLSQGRGFIQREVDGEYSRQGKD